MENNKIIYIIGAGVSGLVAAYELEQEGYQPKIIEKTNVVGGRVKTINEKGYALDLGFQVLLSAYPLVRKYLDMEALQLIKLESGAVIYVGQKIYRVGDPLRNWKILVPTLFANIGSIGDKLKILKLNNILKQKSIQEVFESPETTTHQYLLEFGFSSKIIKRFFKPFFSGIFLESDLKTSSRMFEFVYKMFGDGYATIPKLGIGEISKQLKSKLTKTTFSFNSEVKEVTNNYILMASGEKTAHNGAIITSNTSSLIPQVQAKEEKWKGCMCLYFEVDQTNIPINTIALIADDEININNLYTYTDVKTGKTILSTTTLEYKNKSEQDIIDKTIQEVKKYTGALVVNYIKHYKIDQALPDNQSLKMSRQPSDSQVMDNLFVAGDYLLNGSLNGAMESGRLAAKALIQKEKK